ncbi:hypothetical protein [Brucella sp. NBRC 12950]|uniref:hypothetical protein n=1 Tax=Brucella sp. NBRC 12950 TaxID=2994518 RepID=UPI002555C590|nr:hypothetical protein [Brucella sp. NBRC 12950]
MSAAAAIRTIYIALILAVSARPKHADQNLGSAAELSFWVRNLQKNPRFGGALYFKQSVIPFPEFHQIGNQCGLANNNSFPVTLAKRLASMTPYKSAHPSC